MDFGPAMYPGSWPGLGRVRGWIQGRGQFVGSWIRGFVGAVRRFVGAWIRGGGSWVRGWVRGFVGS